METDYDFMIVSLQKNDLKTMSLFAASMKKRVGFGNRINLSGVMSAFASRGVILNRKEVKRLCYQAQIRGIVPKLIYDGDNMWVTERDSELDDYIESLGDWIRLTDNKRQGQVMTAVSNAIKKQKNASNE